MNPLAVNEQNQALYKQRNILLGISSLLLISNLLFGIIGISKNDKTIIIPALKDVVSITGKDGFSDSYIEQMTLFYIEMLLDLTPDNLDYKSQILLKHVDSKSYHSFTEHYKEESQKYKKYNLATKFDITGLKILKNGEEVEVTGILSSSFGKGSESQKSVTYVIGYGKSHGRLLVKTFNEKQ
jgi:conjugal transfer pilus assembly protein TraE